MPDGSLSAPDEISNFSSAVNLSRAGQIRSLSWLGAYGRQNDLSGSQADLLSRDAPSGRRWPDDVSALRTPEIGRRPTLQCRPQGPVLMVLRVFERWQVPDEDAARVLGTDETGYVADLRSGVGSFRSRDTEDRARLLLDIYEGVFSLFRDPHAERDWLARPLEALNGHSVLDLMTEGSMANLMLAKNFVDYMNGR
jgi:hypothetical protein